MKAEILHKLGKFSAAFAAFGRDRSGAIAVEFSLTMPALLLLLYGILELSHYAYADIALADAAKSGARYAMVRGSSSLTPATNSTIATYVKNQIVLLDPTTVTIQAVFLPNNNPGSAVAVNLTYPFVPFMPGLNFLTASQISASSQMTIAQ